LGQDPTFANHWYWVALSGIGDVEEVSNYLRSVKLVQGRLRNPSGLPLSVRLLSVRLLSDAHRLLMGGVRASGKQPGELRRSQNWVGGTRPGRVVFVPPPPERVGPLFGDIETFSHAATDFPPLVKIALVHVQFETIRPYLDGDGRIGRLLNSPKAGPASYCLFEMLPMMPRFTVEQVRHRLETSFPTANAAVKVLEGLGIAVELKGQKKNRSYSNRSYIKLRTGCTQSFLTAHSIEKYSSGHFKVCSRPQSQ
jgi:Fic family protein